jgi:hypothetical protein
MSAGGSIWSAFDWACDDAEACFRLDFESNATDESSELDRFRLSARNEGLNGGWGWRVKKDALTSNMGDRAYGRL